MFDYHLHLWPHDQAEAPCSIEQVAAYCDAAAAKGVTQIALTEHLFRFRQGLEAVGPFWEGSDHDASMRASMGGYVDHHCHGDLDDYVELVLTARAQGLDVLLGLEVDYYPGRMDKVAELLGAYPFDLLLGSVHWLGAWRFDHLEDPLQMDRWDVISTDAAFDAYAEALEELASCGAVDVLAHPDLIKVAGRHLDAPEEWWDRIAEAAAGAGLAAEVSSAGWRKPVNEQYPSLPLLERFVRAGVALTTASDAHHGAQVGDEITAAVSLIKSAGGAAVSSFQSRVRSEVAI